MESRTKKACWRWLVAGGLALLAMGASERRAEAFVNFGGEAGLATRSHFDWGPAVGGHLEFNPIAGLHVGGYVMVTWLDPDNLPGARNNASFSSFGGRIRYLQPVIPHLRVFGLLGLGYVYADYPGFNADTSTQVNPSTSQQLGRIDQRGGHFLELPVGAGVAYEVSKSADISLGLTWRPGFSFGGDAYSSDDAKGLSAYSKPTGGFSATVGLSLFF